MPQALEVEIGPPNPHELAFVRDSWRRSFQDAPANSAMPNRAYVSYQNSVMDGLIGSDDHRFKLAPGCCVLVARDLDRPSFCFGWALMHGDGERTSLLYVYVKTAFRRRRVAGQLIAAALEHCDADPDHVTYGSRTRFDGLWEKKGWKYRPLQELESR